MKNYLVGFTYHYPEDLKLWNDGVIEDFEASTGIFITANSKDVALEWGSSVAKGLHAQENPQDPISWEKHAHQCWIEEDPEHSCWQHCLGFFQTVEYGKMPDLQRMNAKACSKWRRQKK